MRPAANETARRGVALPERRFARVLNFPMVDSDIRNMRDRSFADFMVGALACISVLGFYAVMRDADLASDERRRRAEARWDLPRKRRRRRTPEDYCRHCAGSGSCEACGPQSCRICRGTGLQPHDQALIPRLSAMWDGIR